MHSCPLIPQVLNPALANCFVARPGYPLSSDQESLSQRHCYPHRKIVRDAWRRDIWLPLYIAKATFKAGKGIER